MDDPKCPVHPGIYLRCHPTSHGTLWTCPAGGCTIRWWGKKNTTPADFETRKARLESYTMVRRAGLTTRIKAELGIEHIGLCDKEQCERIIEWAKREGEPTS